ncbi:MAG: ribonuclease R [Gammaproteobacteria bacterium]|nr:ribonuclease R [Gammaproteobacteria bacterium]
MKRKGRRGDPFAAREAEKYAHPIPSREFLLQLLGDAGRPIPLEEIAARAGIKSERDAQALDKRLRAMRRDGQIVCNRRSDYGLAPRMDLVRGRVSGHRNGFGFLIPDDGSDDLFLSPKEMRPLMHGDRVLASIVGVDRLGRREGAVVEILERNTATVVGRFVREGGACFVVPDHRRMHHDVIVPGPNTGAAENGDIVVVEITDQPTGRREPIGRVVEVLGRHMAPGMEIDVAARTYGLPTEWPEEVVRQAAGYPSEVAVDAHDDRVDVRDLPLVTIDGEDAMDFDDAVYCEPLQGGWRLYVAIADVSAYVQPDTPVDREAKARGTSVYFPGRVIPMLPEILSNELCSLKPSVDRLCMICEMRIDGRGRITRSKFYKGLMRSHARLTYDRVAAAIVDRRSSERRDLDSLVAPLEDLYRLYKILQKARIDRGAIDLDTEETRIVFGPGRKIERIEPVVRNDAHKIIEECMIAANIAAGRLIERQKTVSLYRVHAAPSEQKLEDLQVFLDELGLRLAGGKNPSPKHFARLLERVEDRADRSVVHNMVLRSLAQAMYQPKNQGHFGLALPCYAHFTSPIRRYPDLLVHRAIKHVIDGKSRRTYPYDLETMTFLGEHTSMTERRADEATRDAVNWLKSEYMQSKVGETFGGTVTAVTSFGLFVLLETVYVEGLVHISALGHEYFHFDPEHHRLRGERSGREFRVGDQVQVEVVRVDLDERKVDLELAGREARGAKRGPGRRRRRP